MMIIIIIIIITVIVIAIVLVIVIEHDVMHASYGDLTTVSPTIIS